MFVWWGASHFPSQFFFHRHKSIDRESFEFSIGSFIWPCWNWSGKNLNKNSFPLCLLRLLAAHFPCQPLLSLCMCVSVRREGLGVDSVSSLRIAFSFWSSSTIWISWQTLSPGEWVNGCVKRNRMCLPLLILGCGGYKNNCTIQSNDFVILQFCQENCLQNNFITLSKKIQYIIYFYRGKTVAWALFFCTWQAMTQRIQNKFVWKKHCILASKEATFFYDWSLSKRFDLCY